MSGVIFWCYRSWPQSSRQRADADHVDRGLQVPPEAPGRDTPGLRNETCRNVPPYTSLPEVRESDRSPQNHGVLLLGKMPGDP